MQYRMHDLYNGADIARFEDISLIALAEECAILEDRVYQIINRLSYEDQQVLKDYIDRRNDLEYESVKVALRWKKAHGGVHTK